MIGQELPPAMANGPDPSTGLGVSRFFVSLANAIQTAPARSISLKLDLNLKVSILLGWRAPLCLNLITPSARMPNAVKERRDAFRQAVPYHRHTIASISGSTARARNSGARAWRPVVEERPDQFCVACARQTPDSEKS